MFTQRPTRSCCISALPSALWPCSGRGCPECVGLDPRRGLVREANPTRLDTRQAECKAWGRVLLELETLTNNSSRRSIQPLESRVSVPIAVTATPSAEMPQHSTGDKPLVSKPQLVFPGSPSGTDSQCDRTPPSRRVSLSAPLSQPLCQPEKRGPRAAQEVCYVAAGQPGEDCGWRTFAPACLQAFNTPQGFLLFLCVASFLQGMTVNGFINTVITSIERRYDLHSYQSGLIASSYDVAACLCLTFVSYFGGQGHKPRWLGWGVLVMGAGSLVFALPHFTAGHYEVQVDEVVGTCWANHSSTCKDGASGLSSYRLVFMLGQFLHGMGATPLYTLGVTYLDENVKSSYSPVYIGEWAGVLAVRSTRRLLVAQPHPSPLCAFPHWPHVVTSGLRGS